MRIPYVDKECYVHGDEERMQDTIDYYWWNHINAKEYMRFRKHFTGRICDVGCNVGMSSLLAASSPEVQRVVGVDICVDAIEAARRYARFAGLDGKVVYVVQDFTLECGQLGAESFDGAISFHTLEHIYPEDLGLFVTNLWRILKMGGKVFISIPNGHNYDSPEHVSYFDGTTLCTLFVEHGFGVLDIHVASDKGSDDVVLSGLFVKSMASEWMRKGWAHRYMMRWTHDEEVCVA